MRTESARARAAPPSVNRVNIPERHPATGRYGSITGRDDKTRADQRTNRVGRARLVAGAGAVVAIGALVAGTIAVAGAPADEPARSEQPPQTTAASTATATEESVATSTTSAVATESPTTSTRALPVRSVVSVGAEMQYDQLPFDPATSFGEPERFDREVAIECEEICEIVFDDAAWFWDFGLRLPIENGTVDALREFEFACGRNGSSSSPVTVTADLDVVSTVDVGGRDVPASFSGAVVVEFATVPYQTPNGQGECEATRITIRFPATSNP